MQNASFARTYVQEGGIETGHGFFTVPRKISPTEKFTLVFWRWISTSLPFSNKAISTSAGDGCELILSPKIA